MTDPGIADIDTWASRHPILVATLKVLIVWALLQWGAFLFPPLGWFANVVATVWIAVLLYINRDRCLPVIERLWDAVFAFAVKGYQSVSRESRRAEEYRIEGDTAVRAALMDTVEADIQVAGQVAAWRTQIDRLADLNTSTSLTHDQRRDNELVIRQLRRNIADVEKAEAERTGVALDTHGARPLFDALLPAEAAPARRLGFLPMVPGFSFPFSWALAAVLAVTNLLTFWLWNGARDEARANAEFREGNRQVAEQWRENAQGWRDHARRLEADGTATAGVLAEREAAIARARANERRARRDLENIARDTPPAWFDSVRPPGADALGRPGADGGGGPGASDPG